MIGLSVVECSTESARVVEASIDVNTGSEEERCYASLNGSPGALWERKGGSGTETSIVCRGSDFLLSLILSLRTKAVVIGDRRPIDIIYGHWGEWEGS